jgi:hypothetical protein
MVAITSILLLGAATALAASPVSEPAKYALAGRSANVQARQVIELCAGSPVFTRCGGPWCAPPGMFCCGRGYPVDKADGSRRVPGGRVVPRLAVVLLRGPVRGAVPRL